MIERAWYKDRPAIKVSVGRFSALFLPEDGGKLASIRDEKREYLAQAPGEKYLPLTPEGDYVSSECSGFDDMFPTIDPILSHFPGLEGVTYPDHGEVCRHPMEITWEEESICFSFDSRVLPVRYEKRIQTDEERGGLRIDYHLINRSQHVIPYIWAAHCMIQGDQQGEILHSFSEEAPVQSMFGHLLSRTHMQPFDPAGESYKYYFMDAAENGYCGFRYGDGRAILLEYPKEIVKYLGVWINNGSFKGMYNIALEPCTAPLDRPDTAMQAGCCSELAPQGEVHFTLTITLEDKGENP